MKTQLELNIETYFPGLAIPNDVSMQKLSNYQEFLRKGGGDRTWFFNHTNKTEIEFLCDCYKKNKDVLEKTFGYDLNFEFKEALAAFGNDPDMMKNAFGNDGFLNQPQQNGYQQQMPQQNQEERELQKALEASKITFQNQESQEQVLIKGITKFVGQNNYVSALGSFQELVEYFGGIENGGREQAIAALKEHPQALKFLQNDSQPQQNSLDNFLSKMPIGQKEMIHGIKCRLVKPEDAAQNLGELMDLAIGYYESNYAAAITDLTTVYELANFDVGAVKALGEAAHNMNFY